MKNFFQPTFFKIFLWTILSVLFVPLVKVERIIFCITGIDCQQYTFQSLVSFFYKHSVFLGVDWTTTIGGLILVYLLTCIIFSLNRKDFLIVIFTSVLQLCAIFIIEAGVNFYDGTRDNIILAAVILLGICSFLFSGRRKRTLVFTLVLPLIYLSLFFYF